MKRIALAIGLSGSLMGCSGMRRAELPVEILQVVCEKAQEICDDALEIQGQPRSFSWAMKPDQTQCQESPNGAIIITLTGRVQKSCKVVFSELNRPTATISAPSSSISQY